jgi:hypothetical protein
MSERSKSKPIRQVMKIAFSLIAIFLFIVTSRAQSRTINSAKELRLA